MNVDIICMAVLKRNGKPYFTDSTYFPVVRVEDGTFHRFIPNKDDFSGYIAKDPIENFEENYKIRPFKNFEKEIIEFLA